MNRMYNLPDGRKSIVYAEGNRIMLYTFSARRGNMPIVLKEDYISDLTSVSFYGVIYFAYKNTEGNIVFDGIGEGEEKIFTYGNEEGTRQEIKEEWIHLTLTVLGGELYLMYLLYKMSEGKWKLKSVSPFDEEKNSEITEKEEEFDYWLEETGKRKILSVFTGTSLEYCLWERDHFVPYMDERWQALFEGMKETARKVEEERKEERSREAKRQEELKQKNKELEQKIEHLEEINKRLEEEKRKVQMECEEKLKYAKQRYDELAGIAGKLQEACRKWKAAYGGEEEWMV